MALSAALSLSACQGSGVRQCLDLVDEKEHAAAVELCEQVFDELKAWLLDKKRRPFEALFRLEAQAGGAGRTT